MRKYHGMRLGCMRILKHSKLYLLLIFLRGAVLYLNSSSLLKKVDKLIDWFREAIDEMIEEGEYDEI